MARPATYFGGGTVTNAFPLLVDRQFTRSKKVASVMHRVRRALALKYYEEFIGEYLPHHFSAPLGEHHKDLVDVIQNPKDDKRVVRCEPRESGKSTHVLLGAPAWWLAGRRKHYIAMFGSGGGSLWNHYSTLQNEFDQDVGNFKLLDDFPHLRPMMDFKGQFVSWNDSRMKVSSGAIVEARTMWSKVRGMKEGHYRPDVMVFDDPQDEDDVATDFRRQKMMQRFRTTLLNLIGRHGDIYVIGNFLHPESMVSQLLQDSAWDGRLYRAENLPIDLERDAKWRVGNTKHDGSALWQEMWPLERLHRRREEIKNRAYALEFLNFASSDEEQVYDSTQFLKFHLPDLDLTDGLDLFAFWDPSDPKPSHLHSADFASICVMATKLLKQKDITYRYYWVVHNWLNQARSELQVEEALRVLVAWPIKKMFYEDNGGFGMIMPYLRKTAKERDIALPVRLYEQTHNKVQKIYNAEPIVKRRVFFADHLPSIYFTQWDEFPFGTHDDGPDSTVSLIEAIERYKRAFCI